MANDIKYRCYEFSISVIRFLKDKKWDGLSLIAVKQVIRSAMLIGANVVEARNSSSRIEFKRYYEIALKSSNETKYWLCILRDGFEIKDEMLGILLKECDEVSKILATSVLSIKQKK